MWKTILKVLKECLIQFLRQARQYSLPEICTCEKNKLKKNYWELHREQFSINFMNVYMCVCASIPPGDSHQYYNWIIFPEVDRYCKQSLGGSIFMNSFHSKQRWLFCSKQLKAVSVQHYKHIFHLFEMGEVKISYHPSCDKVPHPGPYSS